MYVNLCSEKTIVELISSLSSTKNQQQKQNRENNAATSCLKERDSRSGDGGGSEAEPTQNVLTSKREFSNFGI